MAVWLKHWALLFEGAAMMEAAAVTPLWTPSVRRAEQGKAGPEDRSTAWARLDAHRATMRRQDRNHDRQPAARASAVAGPRWVGAVEPLEHSGSVVVAEPWSAVGDPDD